MLCKATAQNAFQLISGLVSCTGMGTAILCTFTHVAIYYIAALYFYVVCLQIHCLVVCTFTVKTSKLACTHAGSSLGMTLDWPILQF